MKIWVAHVPYQVAGGEDAHIPLLVDAYRRLGAQIALLPEDRTPPEGLLRKGIASLYSAAYWTDWDEKLKKDPPDFIHVHNLYPVLGPRFLRWALERSVPIVLTAHNHRFYCTNGLALREGKVCKLCRDSQNIARPIVNRCNGTLARSAYYSAAISQNRLLHLYDLAVTRWIAPSPYIAAELEAFGIPPSRIAQIVNPVALAPVVRGRGPRVLYAGRLSSEKGLGTILEAARRAPDLEWRIAGDGPMRHEIEGAGITSLRYLGKLDRSALDQEISAASAGVLASECNEILPTSVLEMLGAGKPCIVSNTESTNWLSRSPYGATLFEKGNADALVQTLRRTLAEPPKPDSQVKALREQLSIDRFSRELSDLVHSLLTTSKPLQENQIRDHDKL